VVEAEDAEAARSHVAHGNRNFVGPAAATVDAPSSEANIVQHSMQGDSLRKTPSKTVKNDLSGWVASAWCFVIASFGFGITSYSHHDSADSMWNRLTTSIDKGDKSIDALNKIIMETQLRFKENNAIGASANALEEIFKQSASTSLLVGDVRKLVALNASVEFHQQRASMYGMYSGLCLVAAIGLGLMSRRR
jgi:hypothetical protein